MARKWVLGIAVVLLLGAVGYFWFVLRDKKIPDAYSGPVDKITVANIGQFSIFNIIAKDKGYFEKYGLDATVNEYDAGGTAMAALLSGQADFAIAADFVGVNTIFKNKELRILAAVSDHDVFRLVARKDKGIAGPADLKGKTIGVTRKTAGEFYLGRFLTTNGLSLPDVTMIDLSPAEMVKRIESGEIDAVLTFEPHAYNIGEKMGNAVLTWSAQGDQRALGLVYAANYFVERHPDVVERYLRALLEAERQVLEHNDESRAFVARTLNFNDAYMRYIWPKFIFTIDLDQDLLLTMEDQARWAIDNGLTDQTKVPNYLDYIYFAALERLKPAAVTVTH